MDSIAGMHPGELPHDGLLPPLPGIADGVWLPGEVEDVLLHLGGCGLLTDLAHGLLPLLVLESAARLSGMASKEESGLLAPDCVGLHSGVGVLFSLQAVALDAGVAAALA